MNLDLNLVTTVDASAHQRGDQRSDGDASKHYRIARGEAMESAASLDVFKLRKLVSPEHYGRGIVLLEGVVAMLTKML